MALDHLDRSFDNRYLTSVPEGAPGMNPTPAFQDVVIKKVDNGFILEIGCKTFVETDWGRVAMGLDFYWRDPVGAEKHFCKR